MPLSQQTYQTIALEDPEGRWELHRGRPREKPIMTFRHNRAAVHLGRQLLNQVDLDIYDVRIDNAWLRFSDETYYIPDVFVLPLAAAEAIRDRTDVMEVYDAPMLFVAEVWSPSTGTYDVSTKLPEYQRRGDLEIWRLHPYDRTVTAWRRQPDGSYTEETFHGGMIELAALPGVVIDLAAVFGNPSP